MPPKGGCDASTCKDLVGKAVPTSVGALQEYDSGPRDPRELHLHLWIKPTQTNGGWALLGCHLALPWASDVEGPGGALGDAMWLRVMTLGAPWSSLPLGLLLEGLLLLNFALIYPASTILQVQVEPSEI